VPPGGDPDFVPVTLSEDAARETGPFVLLGLHGQAAAARLTTLLVRRTNLDARLQLGKGRLVMLAFERRGEDAGLPGSDVTIPRLFLQRGPELQALRLTVQRPGRRREA
jgi:hypothetical protein